MRGLWPVVLMTAVVSLAACTSSTSPNPTSSRTLPATATPAPAASTSVADSGSTDSSPASPKPSPSASVARITDPRKLLSAGGALSKQILYAAQQCTKPTYGICRDDQPAIKVTVTREICGRFASTVPAVATALGFDMSAQHIRGGVTPITDGELLTSTPWQLTEARCQWYGTPEGLPTVTVNIGLVWRTPISDDCSVFPAGSCTALTSGVLQVDDKEQTQFLYQFDERAGGARFSVSTYQRPALTPVQIAAAAVAVRKVATQLARLDP